ncbi:MAG: SIMPL domain-containing protein [Timaviella obliquedivisa GSE-PSE-MK23-08B]|jgi:hypothetical protein|nr:SIMPL domain-containing protein [Timaviella obliquedivisa GSE-PSE-MK23-08B]
MSKLHIFSAAAVTASLWMVGMAQASAGVPQTSEVAPSQQIAQAFTLPAGVTAVGSGLATAPADVAVMYLNYYSNYYPQPSENPNMPPPPPPTATAADMKPVVDALLAAGAIAENIEATADPNASGGFRVRVKLDKPTQDNVQALVAAANTAASKNSKFSTGGAQVGYFTNNCSALETEARRLAMADARSRSNALAATAGITLGSLTAVTESATFGYYGGAGCPSAADSQSLQDPYALQGVDLLSPPVVRVNSSVSVTYKMK